MTLSRRRLMTAMAAAGLAGGVTRPAFAFSTLPTDEIASLQTLHDSACGASGAHQQLVDDVNRTLGDKVSAADRQKVISAMTCPICGCPMSGLF